MPLADILALLAQFPSGISSIELAKRVCGAARPDKNTRNIQGLLGQLASRGQILKRGGLLFPVTSRAHAPPLPPAGWYPTESGPRYWDGFRWV